MDQTIMHQFHHILSCKLQNQKLNPSIISSSANKYIVSFLFADYMQEIQKPLPLDVLEEHPPFEWTATPEEMNEVRKWLREDILISMENDLDGKFYS